MRELSHPTRDALKLTDVLHALSDPTRLKLAACLAGGEEQRCGLLYSSIPKSTLSHHFRVLREAGVILQRPQGVSTLNSLRRDDLNARFPGLIDAILCASDDPPCW